MKKSNGIGFEMIVKLAKQQQKDLKQETKQEQEVKKEEFENAEELEQNDDTESTDETPKSKIQKEISKKKKWLLGIISIISKSFDLIRSIFIRIVFGIHALVAISMVCYVKNELWYLVNSVGVVFLMIEWFVIAFRHGGQDLPW